MRLIALAAAGAFVAYMIWPPAFPFLQADSASYIHFDAMRTAGYPFLLTFIQRASGDLHRVLPVQLFAMVATAAYLAFEVGRLTRRPFLGLAALVLQVSNLFIYRYAFTIMPEALFFAVLAVFAGLLCRITATGGLGTLAAMSLTVGFAILIRPVAYILIPVLIAGAAIGYQRRGRWQSVTLSAVVPLATLLAAGSLAYDHVHGSFRTQSFLGHNLIGKIAYLPGDEVDTRYPEIKREIEDYMARLRDLRPGNLHDRFLLQERQYDLVRYGLTTRTVERIAARDGARPDDIRKEVALAYMVAHPLDYAEEVGLQLYSLWTVADLRTARDNARFSGFVAALPFDAFERTATPTRTPIPAFAVYGIRAFMLGILAISLLALAVGATAAIRRRPIGPIWTALALLSFLLHGYLFLVASLQAGIFRYLIVTWPVIITIGSPFRIRSPYSSAPWPSWIDNEIRRDCAHRHMKSDRSGWSAKP